MIDGWAWQDGAAFAVRHDSGLVAVADGSAACIGGGATELDWGFHRLFHPVITHLLAHQDRFVVHAAAVADGRGALLVLGGTGRGKSTTAMAALRAGWEVLGDDLVVVAPGKAGAVTVIGMPRPMAVPGDVMGDAGDDRAARDPRARVDVAPDGLSTAARPVRALVVTDHAEAGDTTIERLTAVAVLGDVLSSFSATRNDGVRPRFFPYAVQLSRLPSWRLRHAADPGERLAGAAAALASISREASAALDDQARLS